MKKLYSLLIKFTRLVLIIILDLILVSLFTHFYNLFLMTTSISILTKKRSLLFTSNLTYLKNFFLNNDNKCILLILLFSKISISMSFLLEYKFIFLDTYKEL